MGFEFGVVKVIPPAEFVPNASGFSDQSVDFGSLLVRNPARQHLSKVQGMSGAFQVCNADQLGKQDFTVQEFFSESIAAEASRSLKERKLAEENNWTELERVFWQTTLSNKPLYGSDSPGSLFDMESPWNVGNLPSLLHALPDRLPGVKEVSARKQASNHGDAESAACPARPSLLLPRCALFFFSLSLSLSLSDKKKKTAKALPVLGHLACYV